MAALRDLYAEWDRGDFSRTNLFDDEIEFVYSSDFPDPQTFRGIPGMLEGWRRWLAEWDEVTVTATDTFIRTEDGEVIVPTRIRGRGKTSGAPLDEPAANTWRFRDGKAVRLTLYANRDTALREAGPLFRRDPQEVERDALSEVEEHVREARDLEAYKDFTFEEVRMVGEYPRAQIEVLFRWSGHPDRMFGRRRSVWVGGEYQRWDIHDFVLFIGLDMERIRPEVLSGPPDSFGIRWV